MQTLQQYTLLLCVYSTVSSQTSASGILFVKPTDNTTCPGQPCYTLEYCAYHPDQCFTSNTTLYFLTGEHVLELMYSPYYVMVNGIVNLSLVGEGALPTDPFQPKPLSRITCVSRTSFYFNNIMDLSIVNLEFSNCGTIPPTREIVTGAIILLSVIDVSMLNIVIEHSTAFGVLAQGVYGNSVVLGSRFSNNTGSDGYGGGNIFFWYDNADCSHVTNSSMLTQVTIAYSEFSFGHNLYTEAGGLTIILTQSCYNVTANITNTIMYGSTSNPYGNMLVLFDSLAENSVYIGDSHFEAGHALYGGGLAVTSRQSQGRIVVRQKIHISNSNFTSNSAELNGGGIQIAPSSCSDIQIHISNSSLHNNTAKDFGGHIHIFLDLDYDSIRNITSFNLNISITITNSYFHSGRAGLSGGAISISSQDSPLCTNNTTLPILLYFSHSKVSENSANSGGGLGIIFFHSCYNVHTLTYIQHVHFSRNNAVTGGGNIDLATTHNNNVITLDSNVIEHGSSRAGGGMLLRIYEHTQINSNCTLAKIFIQNTVFKSNSASSNGGGLAIMSHRSAGGGMHEHTRINSNCIPVVIFVQNTVFKSNSASSNGGGLAVQFEHPHGDVYVNINNGMFLDNTAAGQLSMGGNIAVYDFSSLTTNNFVRIESGHIEGGRAWRGGGIHVLCHKEIISPTLQCTFATPHEFLYVMNTSFLRNTVCASGNGADVFAEIHSVEDRTRNASAWFSIQVRFENCTFNSKHTDVWNVQIIGSQKANIPVLYEAFFTNIVFHGHSTAPGAQSGIMSLTSLHKVAFTDCEFIESGNGGSALTAIRTDLYFEGNVTFRGNRAIDGGALTLCEGSTMYLKPHTHILFSQNHAMRVGGAIYVEQKCTENIAPSCFFQIDAAPGEDISDIDIVVEFENNTAEFAGSALYGGNINTCVLNQYHLNGSNPSFAYISILQYSRRIFDSIFKVKGNQDASAISSDPQIICFCRANVTMAACGNWPSNLGLTLTLPIAAYPGATFQVKATIFGQKNGTVPGVIHAKLMDSHNSATLGELEDTQAVQDQCTPLNYTVFSSELSEVIRLRAGQPHINYYKRLAYIDVTLKPCPWGFSLTDYPSMCDCAPPLRKKSITCDINTETITRPPPKWIGYFNSSHQSADAGVLLHKNCPFDYCKYEELLVMLNNSDEQCAFRRSGILCGACQQGLSLALGTSQCMKCSNRYLALVLPFAGVGFALVFLLMIWNLTVTEGTINGLIFYANLIHINKAIFFPPGVTNVLTVFIALLNLDLGIETCFYNGMDIYTRTWLQFVFPVNIWVIAGVIILSSHYSITAGKLFRRNAVQVLATLFLLSFAKLQRTIITALSFTYLSYPDGTRKALWLYDGNIEYLHGKHIPLFLAALLALIILSVPYTLILLLAQWLQYKSGHQVLFWVRRWKPLFDAYTGPYKDEYRFWTGLLLIVRTILFLIFALNTQGEPELNLLIMIIATICLLMFTPSVYKKWPLSLLERSFFMNLGVVSTATFYTSHTNGNQKAVMSVSVGIALFTFVGIFTYHTYQYITNSIVWRDFIEGLSHRNNPTNDNELANIVPQSSDGSPEVENRPLPQTQQQVLIFDQFREPLLAYINSDNA